MFPYLAHAAMEPLNCTVALSDKRAEMWMGSQCAGLDAGAAARALGLKPEQVVVHVQMAGGGFGRRFSSTQRYVVEACAIAKAARAAGLNAPVRTIWSREDDIRGGYYRPMHLHRARIGFDERARCWPGTTSSSASPSRRAPCSSVPGEGRHRRHRDRRHARALSAADAPDRASSQAQRAGAVVAQRRLDPHRLRDGDAARRDRPRDEAGPGRLSHAALRRQASAPPCRAATGRGQERLRQDEACRGPRLGRGRARILRFRGRLCGRGLA